MTTARRRIPLFPLNAVAFPGTEIPLRVFEPRYKALLDEAMSADGRFGLVRIMQGQETGGPLPTHEDVGTVVEVDRVDYRGPEVHVLLKGVGRFRIDRVLRDKEFLRADVEELPDPPLGPEEAEACRQIRLLYRRLLESMRKGAGEAAEGLLEELEEADGRTVAYRAANALPLDPDFKQALLRHEDYAANLGRLVRFLRRLLNVDDPAFA